MRKPSKKKFMTIAAVAKELDVSQRSVNRYIAAKKLKATKIGSWRITKKDLQDFIRGSSNIQK
ncbi:MAG: helix-turn-helix domain-containing protein [Patescibacteria group bacterium]|nr:helix-turn-helix domain-containing protein [Patescibacteria group bacterium]